MIITLFTSDNIRHKYFINLLSKISKKLHVVQEYNAKNNNNLFINKNYTNLKKKYFEKVSASQNKFFKKKNTKNLNKNTKILSLKSGNLNKISLKTLSDFLRSDIYILFGCSYVKGKLLNFLIKKKAISLHMGLSPYYIGSDCNFWALYDNNPHLVGATAHYISKKNDSGPILYHSMSKYKANVFDYSMSTSKSCMHSLADKIKDRSIFNLKASIQKRKDQIRHTKKVDFNDKVIKDFLEREINLKNVDFNPNLLINPNFFKTDET